MVQLASSSEQRGLLGLKAREIFYESPCPACGYHIAVPFYDGGYQPLATLAWPRSSIEAKNMLRLPLAFKRCVDCGHVYNSDFEYEDVPYSENPNLMFNKGKIWDKYLNSMREEILSQLPAKATVVEIGCGDGHLLHALAQAGSQHRYLGFDPNASEGTNNDYVEFRQMLFDPLEHIAELRPDMIICRHVMEHLKNPSAFIQALNFAATHESHQSTLYVEVPCIDRVFNVGRIADFYYEHNSHFTTTSLTRMLERSTAGVLRIDKAYNEEVVFGFARLGSPKGANLLIGEAIGFWKGTKKNKYSISSDLSQLHASGKKVAIWGGTGKAAAFINFYEMDSERFPLVVDSDSNKVGSFVPGAGQEIRAKEVLKQNPVDIIFIPTAWRAKDIVEEIQDNKIAYTTILIEHQGHLVDFFQGLHPYNK